MSDNEIVLSIFILTCLAIIGWFLIFNNPYHSEKKNVEPEEPETYLDAIGVEIPDFTKWHIREHKIEIPQDELIELYPNTQEAMDMLRARFADWYLGLKASGLTVGNVVLFQREDVDFLKTIFIAEAWCIELPEGQAVYAVPGKNDGLNFMKSFDWH